MAKKKVTNKGRYIRNANMIGHGGSGITPINDSWTQGVQAEKAQVINFQEAKKRLVKGAQSVASHSMKNEETIKQTVKPRK